jgi:hypothetical protein
MRDNNNKTGFEQQALVCFKCKKPGHTFRNCKFENANETKHNQVNLIEADDTQDDIVYEEEEGNWITDTSNNDSVCTLNETSNDNRWRIEIILEVGRFKQNLIGLIDSGSLITVLNSKYLVGKDRKFATQADSSELKELRYISDNARVMFGNKISNVSLYSIPSIKEDIILGIDQCNAAKIRLDWSDKVTFSTLFIFDDCKTD